MFYRIHRPETQRIEGSGLGLAIVKAVVEKHGSTVRVDSALGEGSVFEFSLPLLAHPNGRTA
jgi:signal transduction histidine kinase